MNNPNLKILIVEDNLSFAIQLEMMLGQLGYHVCGRVDNSTDALRIIKKEEPSLILMDIEINGNMTGVELGQKIVHLNIPILYISLQGNEATYLQAQESNMIGFLVKPVNKISLRSSVELAISKAQTILSDDEKKVTLKLDESKVTKDSFYFTKKGAKIQVLTKDIAYIKAAHVYTETVNVRNEVFVSRTTLGKLEEMLPDNFKRVHRKFIVQVNKISKVEIDFKALYIGNIEIPISKSRRKELKEAMNIVN